MVLETAPPSRRLDPFALPSATTSRFLLLVVTALAGSISLSRWALSAWYVLTGDTDRKRYGSCVSAGEAAAGRLDPVTVVHRYGWCVSAESWREVLLALALATFPVLVACCVYVAGYWWRGRRLVPLPPGTTLAAEGRPIWLDPVMDDELAMADGLPGRPRIVVSATLLVHAARDPRLADGVVRHEQAHLRNRDVLPTRVAWSIWWSFLVVTALPAVVLVGLAHSPSAPWAAVEAVSLLIVLRLERAAVLRSREFYADVRAAGESSSLAYALEAGHRRTVSRPWSWHPAQAARQSVVVYPEQLFGVQWWEAAGVGYLIGFAASSLTDLVSSIWSQYGFEARFVPMSLLLGLIFAGSLGTAIWRSVWRSMTTGAPMPRPAWLALALSAGVLVGQTCLIWSPHIASWLAIVLVNPVSGVGLAVALYAGTWVMVRWTVGAARASLPRARTPRLGALAGVLTGGVVVGPWVGVWCFAEALTTDAAGSPQTLLLAFTSEMRNPLPVISALIGALVVIGFRRPYGSGVETPAWVAVGVSVLLSAVAGVALEPWIHADARLPESNSTYTVLHYVVVGCLVVCAAGLAAHLAPRRGPMRAVAHAVVATALAAPFAAIVVRTLWYAEGWSWPTVPALFSPWVTSIPADGTVLIDLLAPATVGTIAVAGAAAAVCSRRRRIETPVRVRGRAGVWTLLGGGVTLLLAGAAPQYGFVAPPASWLGPWVFAQEKQPFPAQAVPLRLACEYSLNRFAHPSVSDAEATRQPYLTGAMKVALVAEHSDDPLMRAIGAAQREQLDRGHAFRATDTFSQMQHYCMLVLH